MTYLEAVNAVLLRLRQSEVSSWDASNYSKLIGQFVNEAKREVEDAHEWHALRTTIDAAIVVDATEVIFNGTSQRTRIIQVFNATNNTLMYPRERNWIIKQRNLGTQTTAEPTYYSMGTYNSEGEIKLELWSTSDGAYDLTLDAIVPQNDLAENNTMITIPPDPVKLRALALALAERGDDGGQPFAQVMQEYNIALTDAVNRDKDNGPYHEAWVVV